jgi:hypothetical protein
MEAVSVITSGTKAQAGVTGEMEATDVKPTLDAGRCAIGCGTHSRQANRMTAAGDANVPTLR